MRRINQTKLKNILVKTLETDPGFVDSSRLQTDRLLCSNRMFLEHFSFLEVKNVKNRINLCFRLCLVITVGEWEDLNFYSIVWSAAGNSKQL